MPLDINVIKERLLNATKEIARLEKIIEEKNTQLAVAAEGKDRLLHSLDRAFEKEKQLHDKIAGFDIVRNVELLEARDAVSRLTEKIARLNTEIESLIEDVFKKDKVIDELRQSHISLTSDLAKKAEIESEYLNRIEEFKKTMSDLTLKIDEKIKENSSLKDEISELGALLDENKQAANKNINERASLDEGIQLKEREIKELNERYDSALKTSASEIERLEAENNALNLKFAEVKSEFKEEAAPTASIEEDQEKEPTADSRPVELKFTVEESEGAAPHDKAVREQKMIYMEHSGSGIMRLAAIWIAIFIISGLAAWFIFRK
ncbi:MAG: hypothetical protein EPN94_07050 [Nitrospirae bacterium]|nr:MAG: hypothetical protein EPN94_07050 [Nitrospirota bacterium]